MLRSVVICFEEGWKKKINSFCGAFTWACLATKLARVGILLYKALENMPGSLSASGSPSGTAAGG